MKLDPRARKIAVFGSLALTLVAVRWVDGEPEMPRANAAPTGEAAAASLPSTARAPAPKPDSIALDLTRLKRNGGKPKAVDAFGAKNWNPPKKPEVLRVEAAAPPPPPPPPPQAPPLPFTYVGMVGDEDETTVFLAQQDVNHAVKKGDVINGTYRVEEAEAGRVVLTYLPLDQRQTLTAKTE
jgi:hypothetical protein